MMDNGAVDAAPSEVRRAVKRAILLNEYLLRRAWGVLFLALSFSMFLSTFGTPIVDSLESVGAASTLPINVIASGCAVIAILWAFKRVRNSAEITHPEGDRAWSRLLGYRFVVPLWIAFDAAAILTFALARSQVPLVLFLVHLGLAVYLYYALRLSFSKRIPGEAVIAIASLSLGSIASIALLSITASAGPYVLLAGGTILTWTFSGIYARTRPIPEFEEERTGLE